MFWHLNGSWITNYRADTMAKNIFFIFFIILLFFSFNHKTPDEWDIWWHLQVGEDILKEGIWPSPDQYSYLANGNEWVVHSWLAGCIFYIFYIFYLVGGYELLFYLRLINHLLFAFCLSFYLYKKNVKLEYCYCFCLIVMYLIWVREVRPYIFSQWGMFLFYLYCSETLDGKKYYIFPFVMALWTNIHPFSFVVNVILFLSIIGNYIVLNLGRMHISTIKIVTNSYFWNVIAIVAILTSLITPNPIKTISRFYYSGGEGYNFVFAWQNPFYLIDIHPLYILPRILIVFIGLLLFLSLFGSYKLKSLSISSAVYCIVCLYLSFRYERTMWLILFVYLTVIPRFSFFLNNKHNSFGNKFAIELPLIFYILLQVMRGPIPPAPNFPKDVIHYWNEQHLKEIFFVNIYCQVMLYGIRIKLQKHSLIHVRNPSQEKSHYFLKNLHIILH